MSALAFRQLPKLLGLATAVVVLVSGWVILRPLWQDYRIAQAFLEAARSQNPSQVEEAMARLDRFDGSYPAVAALARALEQEHEFACEVVVRAFGRLGERAEAATPLLVQLLKEQRSEERRVHAARALEAIGPRAKQAVPPLLQLRTDPKEGAVVRWHVACALSRIDPEAEAQFWTERTLRVLTDRPAAGEAVALEGSFRVAQPIDTPPLTVKIVKKQPDGSDVTADSRTVEVVQTIAGECSYRCELKAPVWPGDYELKTYTGPILVGSTPVRIEPHTRLIVLDYEGGLTVPRGSSEPALTVHADGTVIVGAHRGYGLDRTRAKLSADELNELLDFIVRENEFFQIDPQAIVAAAGRPPEDVGFTVLYVRSGDREQEVKFHGGLPVQMQATHQLASIQQRLHLLQVTIQAGGREKVEAALARANDALRRRNSNASLLTVDDLRAVSRRPGEKMRFHFFHPGMQQLILFSSE